MNAFSKARLGSRLVPSLVVTVLALPSCKKDEAAKAKPKPAAVRIDAAPPADAAPFAALDVPEGIASASPGQLAWAAVEVAPEQWSVNVFEVVSTTPRVWTFRKGKDVKAPSAFAAVAEEAPLEEGTPVMYATVRIDYGIAGPMDNGTRQVRYLSSAGSFGTYGADPQKVRPVPFGAFTVGSPAVYLEGTEWKRAVVAGDAGDHVFVVAGTGTAGPLKSLRKFDVRLIDRSEIYRPKTKVLFEDPSSTGGAAWLPGEVRKEMQAGLAYEVAASADRRFVVPWSQIIAEADL